MFLNENGLKKLQADNLNYTVNVNGEFKYTITAAHQKIEYVDGNGNITLEPLPDKVISITAGIIVKVPTFCSVVGQL